MKVYRFYFLEILFLFIGQTLFSVTFTAEATAAMTALVAHKEAPAYIQDLQPFLGDFSLKGGVFIPFSYSFSSEVSGGFLFDDKKLELDNLYLEYFGDTLSIIGGKSELQWGYGWFSHPSFFPDTYTIDLQKNVLYESSSLWNLSFSYFFDFSNLNVFFFINNLETDLDNIYSVVVRHDLFFEHLALGWNLAFSMDNQAPEFHSAIDGEIIFNENLKIDFAIDLQYPLVLAYLTGINLNWDNFMFIGELSGRNELIEIDLLSQFTIKEVFSPALAFHYEFSKNAGKFTLLLEHDLSKQMVHGFYLNYYVDFDGDFVNFPLIMTYKLILSI